MKKIILFFFFLIIFFSLNTKILFADSNFSTDYNVTYQVLPTSTTHVRINVVLTNLSAKYYSPSYKITVGFKNINNVTAYDANGKINLDLAESDKGTDISFDFNKAVTGQGNKQTFGVEFDTNEVAQSIGNVWDINVPGLSPSSDFSTFNATVVYPSFLGSPAFIKPNIPGKNGLGGNQITFTKDELGKSGISLAFGTSQTYEFNLKYHLKNPNLFPVKTEIALPPATNYQDVLINSISPKPTNVKIDQDGNWLAEYSLSPSQVLNIIVLGKANVKLNGKQEDLNREDLQNYLKSQKYWETNSTNIKDKVKTVITPEEIYQFVVGTLNYDFSRASSKKPRLGGSAVLNNPDSAVCLEFTDLFVTLARANGIPSREIDGFAFTTNSQTRPLSLAEDVLHAWPEYYDFEKKTWIMVDPTWGNTTGGVDYFNTFDFDHIAFAIHGISSDYPVPAGGYKINNKNQKDVEVLLSKDFKPTQMFNIDVKLKASFLPFLKNRGEIIISNSGNSIIDENEMMINSNDLSFTKNTFTVSKIPPFGFVSTPIEFSNKSFLTTKESTIKILYQGKTFERNIKIIPFYLNVYFLGGVLVVVFIIIISIVTRRSRRISFPKQ